MINILFKRHILKKKRDAGQKKEGKADGRNKDSKQELEKKTGKRSQRRRSMM